MASKIIKLPTAARSYVTVRRRGEWWDVVLATPVPIPGCRSLNTRLYSMSDKALALEHGRATAARIQRPFKAKGGAAA